MPYRSELEALHARLDALGPHRTPRACPACVARSKRHRRIAMFVLGLFAYAGAFALLLFASIAGLVAICALLLGTLMLFSRGDANAVPFGVALLFAVLAAASFAAFAYLERLLAFDVGRFG